MICFRKLLMLYSFLQFSFAVNAQEGLLDSIIHPDSLHRVVSVLAADSLQGRYTGSKENNIAAAYIADEFQKAGLKAVAGNKGYFQEIKPGWNNVIGVLQGKSKPGELVIFSAHYDHVGTKYTNPSPRAGGLADVERNDTIFNGANDDASGVSAVICLARYFAAMNNNERTILFIAFTGEELGLLGSSALANIIAPDSIVAMINIEMIGREKYRNARPIVTGDDQSNMLKILNRNYRELATKKPQKEFFKIDTYNNEHLFRRSDNFPFALKGVPAHTVMLTPPDDIYYHSENDEPNTLNYKVMSNIVQAIAVAATGILSGKDTPSRIRRNAIKN